MNFEEFLERISTATQYNFTDQQVTRIQNECNTITEKYLTRICSTIERSPSHPKNIYGLVLGNIEWARDELNTERLKRERWTTKEDCATPEEFALAMEVTGLLRRFENSKDLLTAFSQNFEQAIKKEICLEFLKRAKEFYLTKIQEGVKLKYPKCESKAF